MRKTKTNRAELFFFHDWRGKKVEAGEKKLNKKNFPLKANKSCVKGSHGEKMAAHKSKTCTKINVTKAAEGSSPVDEYVTPGGYELEKILNRGSVAYTHVNEVWPNVYIGDE